MPIMTRVFSTTGTRFGDWRYEEAIFLANIAIADFLRNFGPRHEGEQTGTLYPTFMLELIQEALPSAEDSLLCLHLFRLGRIVLLTESIRSY